MGPTAVFVSFAAVSMGCGVFVVFVMPETKGKTLEAISAEMVGRKQAGEFLQDVGGGHRSLK